MKRSSLINRTKTVIIMGVSLLALFFATTIPAALVTRISSATADLTTRLITVTGVNLDPCGTAPSVKLANIPLSVNSYSSTRIVATFDPNAFAPGSYLLVVACGGNPVSFDLTVLAGSGGVPNGTQEFKASGSWIVPSGITKLLVEVWGAGGGAGLSYDPDCIGGYGGAQASRI